MENHDGNDKGIITKAEIRQIIKEELAGLKIYITESEITDAQNTVKTIIEQSSF